MPCVHRRRGTLGLLPTGSLASSKINVGGRAGGRAKTECRPDLITACTYKFLEYARIPAGNKVRFLKEVTVASKFGRGPEYK
jgi:hypothetical protein